MVTMRSLLVTVYLTLVPAVAGLLSVESGQDKEIRLPSEGIETDQRYHVVFHVTNTTDVVIYSGKLDAEPDPLFNRKFKDRYRVTSYESGRPLAFILKNITEADAGLYSCQTDTEVEIPGCENLLVVVTQPSQPLIPPPPATVSSSNVSLSCNSTSRSLPAGHPLTMSSIWRRNNITVNDMDRVNVEGLELNITDVPAGYNGNKFSCQTSEGGLTSVWSEEVQLNVLYGPDKVQFNGTEDTVTATGDDPLTVRCSAECNPVCTVTWWDTSRQRAITGQREAVLHIPAVDRSVTGQYMCLINNTHGNKSLTLTLDVQWSSRQSVHIVTPVAVVGCALVIIAIVIALIIRRRQCRNQNDVERFNVCQINNNTERCDNPTDLYAQVNKTQRNRAEASEVYSKVQHPMLLMNKASGSPRTSPERQVLIHDPDQLSGEITANCGEMNQDGLIYADLDLAQPTLVDGMPIIHSREEPVVYEEIDFFLTPGPQLPDKIWEVEEDDDCW